MPKYERVERALRPEFGRERDRERGRDSRERPTSGAAFRAHRAGGQTRSEAGRINDALAQMFQQLEDRMLRPSQGGSLGDLLRLPHTEARREDEDAAVVAAADALAATLSGITSAADVIPWAEANVFARAEGPDTRAGFPRTYPRMLAAVMRHLRALGAPHLALAMFAHARELGLESYLAGCLTSAYNELIRTRWDAFRDLGGVVAAVADMEATAVAWDRSTNIAVTGVVGAVSKDILASTEHRWGADAYVQLAALERSIDTDTQREAAIFERKQMDRREERRRRSHAPTHLYQRETPSPF
jgi:hypothetical protein